MAAPLNFSRWFGVPLTCLGPSPHYNPVLGRVRDKDPVELLARKPWQCSQLRDEFREALALGGHTQLGGIGHKGRVRNAEKKLVGHTPSHRDSTRTLRDHLSQ